MSGDCAFAAVVKGYAQLKLISLIRVSEFLVKLRGISLMNAILVIRARSIAKSEYSLLAH